MAKRVVSMFALAVMMSFAWQAQAQEDMLTEGVRPAGMGEAYTGLASGAASLFHNPGGIAARTMYQLEGTYEYNPSGSVLNASVVDSRTNPSISAGVGYSYFIGHDDMDGVTGHDGRLAASLPVIPEKVAVGVTGRYLDLTSENDGDEETFMQGITIDGGVVLRPHEMVQFGVAGQNLINLCDDPNICSTVAPTTVAAGTSLGDETNFVFALDGGVDITSDPDGVQPFAEVGGEYFVGGVAPIRMGYQWLPARDRHVITAGLGVRVDTAGLDFGFRIDPNDTDYTFFNGSVSMYF